MIKLFGSGALSGKMLLVRTVVKNKIYNYFRARKVKYRLSLPRRVRKGIRIGPCRVRDGLEIGKNTPSKYFL